MNTFTMVEENSEFQNSGMLQNKGFSWDELMNTIMVEEKFEFQSSVIQTNWTRGCNNRMQDSVIPGKRWTSSDNQQITDPMSPQPVIVTLTWIDLEIQNK